MNETAAKHPVFTLTTYPRGFGPYERWEVTAPSGEVIVNGDCFPIDLDAIDDACAAYRQRVGGAATEPAERP